MGFRFVAVIDERTCTDCKQLHGRDLSVDEVAQLLPVHSTPDDRGDCRCAAVATLDFTAAIAVLEAVDRGEITASLTTPRGDTCEPEYSLSNGWRVRVFDDVGCWDYIDAIAPPDAPWFDLWPTDSLGELPWDSDQHRLRQWSPEHPEFWQWDVDNESPGGWRIRG